MADILVVFSEPSIWAASATPMVMLALGFLLMIGAVLIADGFGIHVPESHIYFATAFSAGVEMFAIWARRWREARGAA